MGEHFSSWSERITSPLIFFATLIHRTSQIRLRHGGDQPAPAPPGDGGGARGHVRPALPRPLHHGHRPRRPRERSRDLRRGPGRAAPADGARVHRDRAQALGPGPALRDRRPLLEDLAQAGHLARVQGGLHPAAVPAAAPADRALAPHAELEQRAHGGRARLDPDLRPVLPPALPARALGEVCRRLRAGGPPAGSEHLARLA